MRLRGAAARALALLQHQTHQQQQRQTLPQAAAHCLQQVAALHSLPGSNPAAVTQPEQAAAAGVQHPTRHQHPVAAVHHHQDYHAAALAADEPQQWHSSNSSSSSGSQHNRPQRNGHQQPWQAVRELMQPPATARAPAERPPAAPSQADTSITSTGSSVTASSSPQTGASCLVDDAALPLPGDEDEARYGATDVFLLSSPQEQYRMTLAALRTGQSKNLDQLAHMFEPQALLAAPDKGAAVLEALMFAAAKLEDLQLLRQLLRCTGAANHTLSSAGHRAVLYCLASCGRPVEALNWLQQRVPEQLLHPQLVRSLVQQLAAHQHVQAAQRALDYVEPKLMQRWQHQVQGAADAAAQSAAATDEPGAEQQLSLRAMQELCNMRLLIAGEAGELSAVQDAWAAINQQAQAVQQWDTGSSTREQDLDLLGAKVWANYTLALVKVVKDSQRIGKKQQAREAAWLVQSTVLQAMNSFHAHAWAAYAATWQTAELQQQQRVDQPPQAWLAEQRALAQQQWQQQQQSVCTQTSSWLTADAAVLLPQQVSSAASHAERHACHRAVQGALLVAAGEQDGAQVEQLLQLGSLLKLMPQAAGFEAMLQLKYKQGAPPEALEELLGEMMGWGVIPSVAAYETLMEAYAAHMDPGPAQAVVDRMQAIGHQPILRTYNRLLHGTALNGDLSTTIAVYSRMKLQGLQPDLQTMRSLFKCVRLYAQNVRVATARAIALEKAGDRDIVMQRMSVRAGLFASAYSQLAHWQRDMVAAGLKHNNVTMWQLTQALERLGAVDDCLQLAKLTEDARPGNVFAHKAALRVAGRTRDVRVAGEVSKLTAHLAQGRGLSRADYLAMISSQFWLKQDHEQLLQTVAAMKAAGFSLDASTLQQLLNVYCHNGMWGEALQVLNDVAAGRFRNSTVGAGAQQANSRQQHGATGARRQQGVNGAGGSSSSRGVGGGGLEDDKLWHVVMRKLWEKKASDELLNEFLRHMTPAQLQRFKLMYGLEVLPGGRGPGQRYTLQGSLENWQRPLAAAPAPAAPAGFKQQSRRKEEAQVVEEGEEEEHFLHQDAESAT